MLLYDASLNTLMVTDGDVTTVAKKLVAKRGTTAEASGQPSGNWAAIFHNSTNATTEHVLLVKNEWIASTSTILEIGNDAFGGAYTSYFKFTGDGSFFYSGAIGGGKGQGTINAFAVYDDNVLLTDMIFDLFYDGEMRPEDREKFPLLKIWPIAEVRKFTKIERHLPSMPGRKEWETSGSKSLGQLVTSLWETVEFLSLHIFELDDRIAKLASVQE